MPITSIKVRDFMTTDVITIRPDMEVMKAVSLLIDYGISGAPVVDEMGDVVGMFTEYDCIRAALHAGYHGDMAGRVDEVMVKEVASVHPDTSILDLAERFVNKPYRRFLVMQEERMVGMVARRDILKALRKIY
jgi:CBS domain-containing protein